MAGLFFDSGINDGFNRDLAKMNAALNAFNRNAQNKGKDIDSVFKEIGTTIGAIGTLGALSMAGKELFTFSKDLNTALTEISTISEVVTNNMEEYKTTLIAMSTSELTASQGAVELTKAYYDIASAGYDAERGLIVVEAAAVAATAGFIDAKVAGDGLTTVLNAWKKDVSETTQVSDVFFKTVELGKTTFDQYANNIAKVAPIAATMGVSFEEVSAAVATMTKQGTPTSEALTQITASLVSMNEVLGDGWAKTMTYQQGVEEINKRAAGSTNVMTKMLGRIEAVNAVLALGGENAQMAAQDLLAMNNAMGATEKAAQKVVDSTAHQMKLLKNNILAALEPLGADATSVITELIQKLNAAFESGDIEKYAKVLLTLGEAFAVYKVSVIAMTQLSKVRAMQLATEIKLQRLYNISGTTMTATNYAMVKSFRALKAAFMSNPIGIIVTGLTLAIPLITDFIDKQKETEKTLTNIDKIRNESAATLGTETIELTAYVNQLKLSNAGSEERSRLLKVINENYGTTLQNLDDEQKFLEQIDKAYTSILNGIKKKLALEAQQSTLVELIKQETLAKDVLLNTTMRLDALRKDPARYSLKGEEFILGQIKGQEAALESLQLKQKEVIKSTNDTINALGSDATTESGGGTSPGTPTLKIEETLEKAKRQYQEYNSAVEGLSEERKAIITKEYQDLLNKGKTYVNYLNSILQKETSISDRTIIQKELSAATLDALIQKTKAEQALYNENKSNLDALLEKYATYTQQRAKITKDYSDAYLKLRQSGAFAEMEMLKTQYAEELEQLDESFLRKNKKYQVWVEEILPGIIKKGAVELQKELSALELSLDSNKTMSPETVLMLTEQIKQLKKELDKINKSETDGNNNWKNTIELLNEVNELTKSITNNFSDLDITTKAILTGITETVSGMVNLSSAAANIKTAITAAEKASVILAAIGAALQIISALNETFKPIEEARLTALLRQEKSINTINSLLVEQNRLYAEGNELFTNDKWGTALAGLEAYNLALEYQSDLQLKINSQQSDFGSQFIEDAIDLNQIYRNAQKSSDNKLVQGLGSIGVRTKNANWFEGLVGITDKYSSLLELYPGLIDATGKLNSELLKVVLTEADLTDADKERLTALVQLTEQAEEAYGQFGDYISSIFGGMADEIGQAFRTMYETGDLSMKGLEESFSNMIEQFTQDALEFTFLQPYLNELNEVTKNLGTQYAQGDITSTTLQESILQALSNFYGDLNTVQPLILQAYKNADLLASKLGFDSAFNRESPTSDPAKEIDAMENKKQSVAGQITQAITEETGSIIAGRLGALVLSNQQIANYSADMLDYALQNLLYMKEIKQNTDYLPQIAANTRRTYEKLENI